MSQKIKTNDLEQGEVSVNLFNERLYNSRKLIISITLIATILSSLYSVLKEPTYETTALVEIGEYNMFYDNATKRAKIAKISAIYTDWEGGLDTLIESQRLLIDDLITLFIHKSQDTSSVSKLTINPIANSLIELTATSNSIKDSEDLIYKISSYIEKKHEDITNTEDQRISNLILDEISYLDSSIIYYKNSLENLQIKKDALMNDMEFSNRIYIYEDRIHLATIQQEKLLDNLELINSRVKTKSKLLTINTMKKQTLAFYTIFGFIFGLTLSIGIVLIISSFKGLKNAN